jgi:hypothetical protein
MWFLSTLVMIFHMRYAQHPRLMCEPLLETPTHSKWYNQASAADPQLNVAMVSHFKRRIGSTNQDVVFPFSSEKSNPATICHS